MNPVTASQPAPRPSPAPAATVTVGKPRLPLVVYVLALGTFLMLTSEFMVAGILPEVSADLGVPLARAGLLISIFAIGMVIGAPVTAVLARRLSKRLTLVLALVVFIVGHVIVAVSSDFTVLLAARFLTAFATGAFWAVSSAVASRAGGPSSGARAVGIVIAGGALATALGVPVGVFLAQFLGWRGTFWSLALVSVFAVVLVARLVSRETPSTGAATSLRTEIMGLRSGRLWLTLAACATTSGGVLSAYSFISPILTDKAGVPAVLVPLVLTGFGLGFFIGTIYGGRIGDTRPSLMTVLAPAVTVVLLLGISVVSGAPWVMTVLVVLLGLFGFSSNGVLTHMAVSFAGKAATLGSALSVSAFNIGIALGTALAGVALSTLGTSGPSIVGALIVGCGLVPTVGLAVLRHRRTAGTTTPPAPAEAAASVPDKQAS